MNPLLAVRGLSKRFGGLVALDRVSFDVGAGEVVGLIGPNGSGKTTLLNVLSGFYAADGGDAFFNGVHIGRRTPAELSRLGIARSFQVTKVFRRLSVLENLLVPGLIEWRTSRQGASERGRAILERLELARLADQRAAHLSGGQAKLLEFGRLMMLEPRLVLLEMLREIGEWRLTLFGLLVIVILRYAPNGLFGALARRLGAERDGQ